MQCFLISPIRDSDSEVRGTWVLHQMIEPALEPDFKVSRADALSVEGHLQAYLPADRPITIGPRRSAGARPWRALLPGDQAPVRLRQGSLPGTDPEQAPAPHAV